MINNLQILSPKDYPKYIFDAQIFDEYRPELFSDRGQIFQCVDEEGKVDDYVLEWVRIDGNMPYNIYSYLVWNEKYFVIASSPLYDKTAHSTFPISVARPCDTLSQSENSYAYALLKVQKDLREIYDKATGYAPSVVGNYALTKLETGDLNWVESATLKTTNTKKKVKKDGYDYTDVDFSEAITLGNFFVDKFDLLDTLSSPTYSGNIDEMFEGWKSYFDDIINYDQFLAVPSIFSDPTKDVLRNAIILVHDNFEAIYDALYPEISPQDPVSKISFRIRSILFSDNNKVDLDELLFINVTRGENEEALAIELQMAQNNGTNIIYSYVISNIEMMWDGSSSYPIDVEKITVDKYSQFSDSPIVNLFASPDPAYMTINLVGAGNLRVYSILGSGVEVQLPFDQYPMTSFTSLFPLITTQEYWAQNSYENLFYFDDLKIRRVSNASAFDKNYLRDRLKVISPKEYDDRIFDLIEVQGDDDLPQGLERLLLSVYDCQNLTNEFSSASVSKYVYCIQYMEEDRLFPTYATLDKSVAYYKNPKLVDVAVSLNCKILWNLPKGKFFLGLAKLEENPRMFFQEIGEELTLRKFKKSNAQVGIDNPKYEWEEIS